MTDGCVCAAGGIGTERTDSDRRIGAARVIVPKRLRTDGDILTAVEVCIKRVSLNR
jgi:hypothetical protein